MLHDKVSRVAKRLGRKRVAPVRQQADNDCGPAALAMVLKFHGRHTELKEVCKVLNVEPYGADAAAIIRVGRTYGLHGRGVYLEVENLDQLPMGAILYCLPSHFVVFERLYDNHVDIVDPKEGCRSLTLNDFRERFTGVALIFEPTKSFQRDVNI